AHRARQLAVLEVDDVPIPADRKAAHPQLDQTSARELERTRVAGEDGKSKPRLDRMLDRPVGAKLHRDDQLEALLARCLLERPAAARCGLAHDEGLIREVLQRKASASREWIARGRDDDELVAEKWNDREVRVLQRRPDHGKVELVAQDLLLHAG